MNMKLPSILWRDFSEDHSMLLDCPTMIYIYNAIFYKNDQFPFFFTRSLQHIFTKKKITIKSLNDFIILEYP